MFCSNCGTEIKSDAKFCFNCGAKNDNAVNSSPNTEIEIKPDETIGMEKYAILDSEIKISTGVLRYQELKSLGYEKARAIYERAVDKYVTREIGTKELSLYDKCNVLSSIGKKACNEMENECIEFIYQLQLMNYSKSDFISDIPKTRSYIAYLENAKEEVRKAKEQLDKNAQKKFTEREIRKNSRGRFIGGGFGITGAIKGTIQAGVLNLFTGAIHTAVNIAGNTATVVGTSLKKHMINSDVEAEAFFEYLLNDLYKMVDRSLELLATKTDKSVLNIIEKEKVEQAESILENIESGKFSEETVRDSLLKGITLNPLNKRYYFTLLKIYPNEKDSIMVLLEKLYISKDEFLNEFLENYADIEADDETIERLIAKKTITAEDVAKYRDCYIEQADVVTQYICNTLGFEKSDVSKNIVNEYVEDYLLGIPDEKFKKMEVACFTDSYEIVFGPDYIWAETYEDMIEYLNVRADFEKKFNNEKTIFLYQFSVNQSKLLSEDTSADELSESLIGVEKGLSELLDILQELDPNKIFTEYLYDGLTKIHSELKSEIDRLPEYKKIREERQKKWLEVYAKRQDKFKKVFYKNGMYGKHCFNVVIDKIPSELMNEVSNIIQFNSTENKLMIYGFVDEGKLLTGFVLTDQNLYIWGLNGDTKWKLEDIKEVSVFKSDGAMMLSIAPYTDVEKHRDVFVALNPINEYEDLLYKINIFLTDINTRTYEKKDETANKSDLIMADEEHELVSSCSKRCVVGTPYVFAGNMKKFDVAISNIGVPSSSKVFMMYDVTLLGSWKKGIAFCDDAIYHNMDGEQVKISWKDFATIAITKKSNLPYIGKYQVLCEGGDTETLLRLFMRWQKTVLTYIELFEEQVKTESDTMFCAFCGKQIKRGVKFCNFCGEKVR